MGGEEDLCLREVGFGFVVFVVVGGWWWSGFDVGEPGEDNEELGGDNDEEGGEFKAPICSRCFVMIAVSPSSSSFSSLPFGLFSPSSSSNFRFLLPPLTPDSNLLFTL